MQTIDFLDLDYIIDHILDFGANAFGWDVRSIQDLFSALHFFSAFLAIGFIALAFWLFLRLLEMEEEHAEHVYHHAIDSHASHVATGQASLLGRLMYGDDADLIEHVPTVVREDDHPSSDTVQEEKPGLFRWNMVLRHASSQNPSDWKLAIIEADTILDALTEGAGFSGMTLGERLKSADTGTFRTLQLAWDAHTVRNRIAHEGSAFYLDAREKDRVLRLYEEIFREFNYI